MFIELTMNGLRRKFRVSEIAAVTESDRDWNASCSETGIVLKSGQAYPVQESYEQVLAMIDKEVGHE